MRMSAALLVLASGLSTAACSSIVNRNEARVLSMSEDRVTLRYKEGYLSRAQTQADAICQDRGRIARLDRVTRSDGRSDSSKRVASFFCV